VGTWIGLMLGLGLLLIWRSALPRTTSPRIGAGFWTRRTELLKQAGLSGVSAGGLLGAQVTCAVVVGLIVVVISSTLAIAVCAAVFSFLAPTALVRRMRRQRLMELRDQWPEAVDNLASAVRAGLALPEAVAGLATHGPTPLRPAFSRFAAAYRASGRFGACLDSLSDELADPVGDRVCETVRIAREVGGHDLGTVLRTLSELLRTDARTRAEIETRQGFVVNGARVAAAAPWLVLLMLSTQSSTVKAYDSFTGVIVLSIGAFGCMIAYQVMLRVGRLPESPRVLQR
jgi:tight adherence protein B